MNTKLLYIKEDLSNLDELEPIARAMDKGQVVCFPTETVYGLGARYDLDEAVKEIFRVKGRPQDNPLILHESSVERMAAYYKDWDKVAETLTAAFCPGPFTLIMEKADDLKTVASAGLNTIGLRIPDHPVAHALIKYLGRAIAAPSANISGRPSPTNGSDAYEDLAGKVPYIVVADPSRVGLESTIVSWVGGKLELLRPGGISAKQIGDALIKAGIDPLDLGFKVFSMEDYEKESKPRAPGMKYRHYAPRANVHIIKGDNLEDKLSYIKEHIDQGSLGLKPGFYISIELNKRLSDNPWPVLTFEDTADHHAGSHYLFTAFRELDREACSDIWVENLDFNGLGQAYMNRLEKAACKTLRDPSQGPHL